MLITKESVLKLKENTLHWFFYMPATTKQILRLTGKLLFLTIVGI